MSLMTRECNLEPFLLQSKPLPPMQRGLPFLGSALQLAKDPITFFVKMYQKHGPIFSVRILGKKVTVLAGPEANLFVARNGKHCFSSKAAWDDFAKELGVESLMINTDGLHHARYRKLQQRGFSPKMLVGRVNEAVELTKESLMAYNPGDDIPMVQWMRLIASDQLGTLMANRKPDEYFEDVLYFLNTLLRVTIIKNWPRIALKNPKYIRAKRRAMQLAEELLYLHQGKQMGPYPDLVDDILNASKERGVSYKNKNELLTSVLGPYFAGLDTVANTTACMIYAILKHPELKQKIQKEADEIFADGSFSGIEDIKKLKYARLALMETMRMYPVAPMIPRIASCSFEFAGHRVKKGEDLFVATTSAHFLPELYKDPETFDITRFDAPRLEHRQPGAFAPYGAGPHACLGANLGEMLILVTVATIFHQAELSLQPQDYELKLRVEAGITPGKDFKLRLLSRRNC
mgnify:CR=1 FL=1